MSAAFSIEKPTVVATLPRPIDHSAGRYVVSEVHSGTPGSRKRKRSELAVGVDGEGLNIYKTHSSKLVTSYALPPRSSFTCPPCSVCLKSSGKTKTERRTYVSTQDLTSNITFFRDITSFDGTTKSTSKEKKLQGGNKPVTFLNTLYEQGNEDREDLLLIRKDGEIQCLNGIDLETRWTSPANTIGRNTKMPDVFHHEVQFAHLTDAVMASKRLLKGREDILSVFPQEMGIDGFNPPILVIITIPTDPAMTSNRTLHIVSLPSKTIIDSTSSTRSVHPLLSIALPDLPLSGNAELVYNLQVASGVLHVLDSQYLISLDLSDSRPKIQSLMYIDNAKSFLPLSRTSVIAASEESVNIYNRNFQSIQASMSLKTSSQSASRKRKFDGDEITSVPKTYNLVAYSAKQSVAYAIAGNDLVAFQIDSRQDIPGRRRAHGRLIDTIGCGIVHAPSLADARPQNISLKSLGKYTIGSDPTLIKQMDKKLSELDNLVVEEDIEGFERIMAAELGIIRDEEELDRWRREKKLTKVNGVVTSDGSDDVPNESAIGDAKPIPLWVWAKPMAESPEVNPRLIRYALSRIFSWRSPTSYSETKEGASGEERLVITFFPHNLIYWLIETGTFNHGNIQSALRYDAQISVTQKIPIGQLVDALADLDPEFTMLFSLISNTHLDALGLLYAIRLIMQSLELFGDSPIPKDHLLTNGDAEQPINGDLEAEIEMEQEKAATALNLAEQYLNNSSIRGRTLSLALAKLHTCPESAVVSGLRSTFTSAEIVSLIYLLRFELARGAWTSRYLDTYEGVGTEDESGQDNTILLVSGLLNCCIDAIGAGGWLSGDSMLVNGDHIESEELISSLKLEVSAALEGIEEASYLKGLIAEMVRYGEGFQRGPPPKKKADSSKRQPITIHQAGHGITLLPIGMKSEQQFSRYRVGAGGEIQQRTMRDIGQLKSKKVGKYSRERIVI